MLFLRSLIDFPSNFHRICIEFASALQRRIIGGILENFAKHFPLLFALSGISRQSLSFALPIIESDTFFLKSIELSSFSSGISTS